MNSDYRLLFGSEDCGFMLKQKLTFDMIFDARGLKKSEYRLAAKSKNLDFVFVGRSCHKGHFLKLRSGNCPICCPSSLGFTKRQSSEGFVYVAHSRQGRLVKVGATECLTKRLKTLNKESYAGFCDWIIKESAWSEKAFKVEAEIQSELHLFQVLDKNYFKGNSMLAAREVFRVQLHRASEIFHSRSGTVLKGG